MHESRRAQTGSTTVQLPYPCACIRLRTELELCLQLELASVRPYTRKSVKCHLLVNTPPPPNGVRCSPPPFDTELKSVSCTSTTLLTQSSVPWREHDFSICTRAVAASETASELLQRAAEPAGEGKAEFFDGRAFRRSLGKTGRYTRNPKNDKESLDLMDVHGVGYSAHGLIAQMRDSGRIWKQVRGLGFWTRLTHVPLYMIL